MAWKKRDDFFDDDNDSEDDNNINEVYDYGENEERKERKKETAARWTGDESRALLKLAAEGKIDFSQPATQHSENLKNLRLKFPGRSDRVLQTHFGDLKAKALTATAKSGARKRDAGYESDNKEEEMFVPKKPSAGKKKPAAAPAKKNSPDDDDDAMMPTAASTSRAKTTQPADDYNIRLLDVGHCFSYTKDGEHKVEVNIHVLGVIKTGSFQTQVSDDGMWLLFRQGTPVTFFDESIGDKNALCRNDTRAVALQNAVRSMRGKLGLTSRGDIVKYHFGEWQRFRLKVECLSKIAKTYICKTKGGELNVGGVVQDQYNSIVQIILTAKEQYEEESDDDVQELILGGGNGGGKRHDKRSSYGGDDDDDDRNESPPSLPAEKWRSMTKTNGESKRRTISSASTACHIAKQEPGSFTTVKPEYLRNMQKENRTNHGNIAMVEIDDSDSDDE